MSTSSRIRRSVCALALCLPIAAVADAHDGPPFPIVSSQPAGPYILSVWTDPDATDDGSAGGQFWVLIESPGGRAALPEGTRVSVTVRPLDREGVALMTAAAPVRGDPGNQFAGLVMDHEGRYAVDAVVEGPLGSGAVAAEVEATYDTRPPAYMLIWSLAPFVLLGVLWARLLLLRRRAAPLASGGHRPAAVRRSPAPTGGATVPPDGEPAPPV